MQIPICPFHAVLKQTAFLYEVPVHLSIRKRHKKAIKVRSFVHHPQYDTEQHHRLFL